MAVTRMPSPEYAHRNLLRWGLRAAHDEREALGSEAPVIDVPMLRKAVEWVREQAALPIEQSAWFQMSWWEHGNEIGRSECGTAYCVAGYVTQMMKGHDWLLGTTRESSISGTAQEVLGLTETEAEALFDGHNTLADIEYVTETLAGEKL